MNRIDNPELKRKILDHLADLYKIREVRESNHLSSYVTCRTKSFFDAKGTTEPTEEEVMLFALGYGLQDVLTPKSIEPVVYRKEGVIYRPDLPMIWTGNLGEIKTTRKSAKYHYMEDSLPLTWIDYMAAGCYLTGTVKYDLAMGLLDGKTLADFNKAALDNPIIRADTALLQSIGMPPTAANSFANVLKQSGKFYQDDAGVFHAGTAPVAPAPAA